MVSDTLRNLARQFGQWKHGGVRLDTAACELAESVLDDAAEQCRILEGAPAPVPPAQAGRPALRLVAGGAA